MKLPTVSQKKSTNSHAAVSKKKTPGSRKFQSEILTCNKKKAQNHQILIKKKEFWDETGPTSIFPFYLQVRNFRLIFQDNPSPPFNQISLQPKTQQKNPSNERERHVSSPRPWGNETKICAMEPTPKLDGNLQNLGWKPPWETLKLDGNFDDLLFQGDYLHTK